MLMEYVSQERDAGGLSQSVSWGGEGKGPDGGYILDIGPI